MTRQGLLVVCYLGIAVVAVLVTPFLGTLLLSYLIDPSAIFSTSPWYLPVPLLAYLVLCAAAGCSPWLPARLRRWLWAASAIYWLTWLGYFVFGLSLRADQWAIWTWHLLLLAISVALLRTSIDGNTGK